LLAKAAVVPAITAGGRDSIGLRVPGHPVPRDLVRALGRPVVGPSANRSGRPSPVSAADVLADLGCEIDAVLDGGPAPLGLESTVLDLTVRPPAIVRAGAVGAADLRRIIGELAAPEGARVGAGRLGPKLIVYDVAAGGGDRAAAAWQAAVALARQGVRVGMLAPAGGGGGCLAGPAPTPPGVLWLKLGDAADERSIAAGLYPALRAAVNSRLLALADEVRDR
jgi:L-threonylcarbamoyladenylate synthase